MRYLTLLFTAAIIFSPLWGMSEFDELAHQITDDIRANRPVTPEFIESWYDHGDQAHIRSVCDAFPLPADPAARAQEVLGLEDLLVEHKELNEKTRFHELMGRLSPNKRQSITLLLTNYMIGIPE